MATLNADKDANQTTVKSQDKPGLGRFLCNADVKLTLNLRNETALAWVMPDGWAPQHE